jgi:hypothetical protein
MRFTIVAMSGLRVSLRPFWMFVVWAAALTVTPLASAAHDSGASGTVTLKVIATNLNNPRKIFLSSSGAAYVVEAGTGGKRCLGSGTNKTCLGPTGSVTEVENGVQKRLLTGLISFASPNGQDAEGAADVRFVGGRFYVLLQDADINSKGQNPGGPMAASAGDLISSSAGPVAPKVIANLARFEALHNPDHGVGPGPKLGDPPIDSDPYAFTPYKGGWAVADAAANDLLWISSSGKISVLAVFPVQTEFLTPAIDKAVGAPPGTTSVLAQSVPTSVTLGPDGDLYVGELTGAPFLPGTAHIWKVIPGSTTPDLFASGFTNISDLAFDGKNLLVLEIASKGLSDPKSPGALIKVAPDGKRTVIASAGLAAPAGLAVGNGKIYISNNSVSTGSGKGPHGELVTIPASLGS